MGQAPNIPGIPQNFSPFNPFPGFHNPFSQNSDPSSGGGVPNAGPAGSLGGPPSADISPFFNNQIPQSIGAQQPPMSATLGGPNIGQLPMSATLGGPNIGDPTGPQMSGPTSPTPTSGSPVGPQISGPTQPQLSPPPGQPPGLPPPPSMGPDGSIGSSPYDALSQPQQQTGVAGDPTNSAINNSFINMNVPLNQSTLNQPKVIPSMGGYGPGANQEFGGGG